MVSAEARYRTRRCRWVPSANGSEQGRGARRTAGHSSTGDRKRDRRSDKCPVSRTFSRAAPDGVAAVRVRVARTIWKIAIFATTRHPLHTHTEVVEEEEEEEVGQEGNFRGASERTSSNSSNSSSSSSSSSRQQQQRRARGGWRRCARSFFRQKRACVPPSNRRRTSASGASIKKNQGSEVFRAETAAVLGQPVGQPVVFAGGVVLVGAGGETKGGEFSEAGWLAGWRLAS